MIKIENDALVVTIAEHGAEMLSIHNKETGLDYLWDGNPEFWGEHAPVLFPIIGRLNNYQYKKGGKVYEIPQHGLAKINDFEVAENTGDSVTFALKSNDELFAHYPYKFVFKVRYSLKAASIKQEFIVENHSGETMPYSVGGHPGFNVPLKDGESFEDYQITIEPRQNVNYFEADPCPWLSGKKLPFNAMVDGILPLTHEVFGKGLIIIDEPSISTVTLADKAKKHGVTLHIDQFPYLCLWTNEQIDSPFLCVEPFQGLPDIAGEVETLEDKPGMRFVQAGETDTISFVIDTF